MLEGSKFKQKMTTNCNEVQYAIREDSKWTFKLMFVNILIVYKIVISVLL